MTYIDGLPVDYEQDFYPTPVIAVPKQREGFVAQFST